MSELVEYFVRHYSLVLDNDRGSYNAVRRAVRDAVEGESPELTLSEYRAMSAGERRDAFAEPIGAAVLELVDEWVGEVLGDRGDVGALLIREVLMTNGSSLAWALGESYIPEDADAAEFLFDEDDDDADDMRAEQAVRY